MVKDDSDSERGSLLLPHLLLFPISSKGSFLCTILDRIIHGLYNSCGALAGTIYVLNMQKRKVNAIKRDWRMKIIL